MEGERNSGGTNDAATLQPQERSMRGGFPSSAHSA